MNVKTLAGKKLAGIPAWAWAATLVVMLGYVVYRRRAAAAAAAAIEDEGEGYSGEDPFNPGGDLNFPGGGYPIGGEEGSFDVSDWLSTLEDRLSEGFDRQSEELTGIRDSITESSGTLGDQLDVGFEQIGELITDGYNQEPGPTLPDDGTPGGGSPGGGGDGQLPGVDDPFFYEGAWHLGFGQQIKDARGENAAARDRVEELRAEIERIRNKPGPLTEKERKRIEALQGKIENQQDKIATGQAEIAGLKEAQESTKETLVEAGFGPDGGQTNGATTKAQTLPLVVKPSPIIPLPVVRPSAAPQGVSPGPVKTTPARPALPAIVRKQVTTGGSKR